MQQLASQSTQHAASGSLLFALNRINLKTILDNLTQCIQEFNLISSSETLLSSSNLSSFKYLTQLLKNDLQSVDTISNQQQPAQSPITTTTSINKTLNKILIDLKTNLNNEEKILDPSLEPLVNELIKLTSSSSSSSSSSKKINNSFFENRHGFNRNDLLLNSSYQDPTLNIFLYGKTRLHLHMKQNQTPFIYSQLRGFKTKRVVREENQTSSTLHNPLDFNFKNFFSSPNISSNSSIKRLGSILEQSGKVNPLAASQSLKKDPFSASSNAGNLKSEDITSLVKNAFTEGVIFGSNRSDYKKFFFRLFLFTLFVFFLLNSVIIVNSSNANNKNGTGGGGINLRALTGTQSYEISAENISVKFNDVKGLGDAKKELIDIVDFLKEPERYSKIGARLPKGILLVGPPGCGKTLLAKAVAGEAGVPYFQANGSDFDEMFVGTGSKRVRSLFAAAREKAPCVIFIDEIDSVGSQRTNSSIHPHANQTINQLLAEMDGFKKNEGIIVLGATNRRDALDNALIRPGRFDMEVRIDRPDFNARCDILEYYLDKVARDQDVDVAFMSRKLAGFGGSAIENVVNQAALRAAVTRSDTVKMEHLEWSLDRSLMGYGKSRLTDEECNKTTAYHEAGHALVAYFTKDSHPLHKVTILPRGMFFVFIFETFFSKIFNKVYFIFKSSIFGSYIICARKR